MRIDNGNVLVDGRFQKASIRISGEAIGEVVPLRPEEAEGQSKACKIPNPNDVDARGCYVIPALIDLHFHGAMGFDLCDATEEAIFAISEYEAANGIGTICPATMTLSKDRLERIMTNAKVFRDSHPSTQRTMACSSFAGINMEGPYISSNKLGAQNPEFVRKASLDELKRLNELSGDLIKIVDVAPETEGAIGFISEASHAGFIVSIAHTCATYDQALAAIDAGATQVTHLFNAMPGISHRQPGPIVAASEAEQVSCELICDGVHIHPAVIRFAFKLFGAERIILISDSMRACGLEDGTYDLGGQSVNVHGNKATLEDGALAGSVTNLMDCMRYCIRNANVPMEDAIRAATENPARTLGIFDEVGSIEQGKRADLLVLDEDLELREVILRGNRILG